MPLRVWYAYADRAPWALNDLVIRAGIAAMMPHMPPGERRSLISSLQRQRQVAIQPTSIQEASADAGLYGIQFEDARVLN